MNQSPHQNQLVEKLKSVYGGPMSADEVQFLRDMQGFIAFAIRNGLSFRATMSYLSHDWNEFAREGFDFESVIKRGFLPRVTGASEATPDAVGAAE